MRIKLKVCGIKSLYNAIEVSRLGVDFIGFVTEPSSPRYAPEDVVVKAKKVIGVPIVSVKVFGSIESMAGSVADFIQIHRVLEDKELEILSAYDTRRFILYVPADLKYLGYLKKVQRHVNLVLFDSPVKGVRTDPKILKVFLNHHSDAGVAGGITPENVHEYLQLEPMWIDVSSGVELAPGIKDLDKVKKLVGVVHSWKRKG